MEALKATLTSDLLFCCAKQRNKEAIPAASSLQSSPSSVPLLGEQREVGTAFVRAQGGLCNKLRAVLSHREYAADRSEHLVCIWVIGPECPARFCEMFMPLDGVTFVDSDEPGLEARLRALGAPLDASIPRAMRSHPAIAVQPDGAGSGRDAWLSDRESAMFAQLTPCPELMKTIEATISRCGTTFAALHVRRTDHVELWGVSTPDKEFFTFVDSFVARHCTPASPAHHDTEGPASCSLAPRVFLATDNAETQSSFAAHCEASSLCGLELVTAGAIERSPGALRHTSVASAVVDLYVCAAATVFKGTRGSSFSEAIYLLRRAHGVAHPSDELQTARSSRRRRWRQQKREAALTGRGARQHAADRRSPAAMDSPTPAAMDSNAAVNSSGAMDPSTAMDSSVAADANSALERPAAWDSQDALDSLVAVESMPLQHEDSREAPSRALHAMRVPSPAHSPPPASSPLPLPPNKASGATCTLHAVVAHHQCQSYRDLLESLGCVVLLWPCAC